MSLLPAYGRTYNSKDAVLKDWNSGKDFQDAVTMQYCNKDDAPEGNHQIRYGKNHAKVLVVTVPKRQ